MGNDEYDASFVATTQRHHPRLRHTSIPYSSSLATCTSALTASSAWTSNSSDSSQASDDSSDYGFSGSSQSSSQSSISSVSSSGSVCAEQRSASTVAPGLATSHTWPKPQRQNPRRTGTNSSAPSLHRQSDRRTSFVDHLVDASTQIVQAIWPLSSVIGRGEGNANNSNSNGSYLLPLRTFIQETLRRSRASYSTLQVALYYLLLIKPRLPSHNFTMEQSTDSHACRALQCGRRMFLAALILASKYLQDRNYSARAWSKISGLSTVEINQNETAFLHAVNWRLHITNEVYNRWTDCVNKFNPPQLPPSPGPAAVEVFEQKCEEFRLLIQKLTPTLENLDELCASCATATATPRPVVRRRSSCQFVAGAALSLVSLRSSPEASSVLNSDSYVTPAPVLKPSAMVATGMVPVAPNVMEPSPVAPASFTPGRLAPAMGLLPTPKLAPPQVNVFGTPASGASMASQMLAGGRSSMCYAVAQASNSCASQFLDRWPAGMPTSTSPVSSVRTRRSSLANSVSTASSPESMISDSSLLSRSSSVSSAWSMMSAPSSTLSKLDTTQARHRYAKLQCSGGSLREKSLLVRPTAISVVREDYEEEECSPPVFASPESMYSGPGPLGKDATELPQIAAAERRLSDMDATDAALALAELQSHYAVRTHMPVPAAIATQTTGQKRSRPVSVENSLLQDNVRELLRGNLPQTTAVSGARTYVAPGQLEGGIASRTAPLTTAADLDMHLAVRAAALTGSRKRLCRKGVTPTVAPVPSLPCSYGLDLQHSSMNGLNGLNGLPATSAWQEILN